MKEGLKKLDGVKDALQNGLKAIKEIKDATSGVKSSAKLGVPCKSHPRTLTLAAVFLLTVLPSSDEFD